MPTIIPTSDMSSGSGGISFDAPSAIDPSIYSRSSIVSRLDASVRDRREKQKLARAEQAAQAGAIAQSRSSGGALAMPDPDGTQADQLAFLSASREVQAVQLRNEAQATAQVLRSETLGDPQAFADAFDDYTRKTVNALEGADAITAAGARVLFQGVRNSSVADLQIQANAAMRVQQQEAFSQGARDIIEQGEIAIAAGAGEEVLLKTLGDHALAQQAGFQGPEGELRFLTTPQKARGEQAAAQKRLADTFVARVTLDAEAADDAGAALAAAKKLESGAWYENPVQGLVKARELRRLAIKIQGKQKEARSFAGELLGDMVAAAGAGLTVNPEESRGQYEQAMRSPNPKVRFDAQRDWNALAALHIVRPQIETSSPQGLTDIRSALDGMIGKVDRSVLNVLAGKVKAEEDRRIAAALDGNPNYGKPDLNPLVSSVEDFQKRQQQNALELGIPLTQVPLLPAKAAASAGKGMEALLAAGDIDGAVAAAGKLAELAGSPMQLSRVMSGTAGAAGAATVIIGLQAAGLDPTGFGAMAAAGANAPTPAYNKKLLEFRGARQIIGAMSQGDARIGDGVRRGLEQARNGAYAAAVAQKADPASAQEAADAAVEALFSEYKDGLQELDNGQVIHKSSLTGPGFFTDGQLKTPLTAANDMLKKLGTDYPWLGDQVTVRAASDGTLRPWDVRRQEWVLGPQVKSREMAQQPELPAEPGFMAGVMQTMEDLRNGEREPAAQMAEQSVAKKTGVPAELLRAVRTVTKLSPPQDLMGVGEYNIPSQAAKGVPKKLFMDKERQDTTLLSGALLSGYLASYKNTEEALYAYALGPDVLEAAKSSGPDWRKSVPMQAGKFVARVMLEMRDE